MSLVIKTNSYVESIGETAEGRKHIKIFYLTFFNNYKTKIEVKL